MQFSNKLFLMLTLSLLAVCFYIGCDGLDDGTGGDSTALTLSDDDNDNDNNDNDNDEENDDDDDNDDNDNDDDNDNEQDTDEDETGSCEGVNTGPLPPNCVKTEDIGQDGVVLEVNGVVITILKWIPKDGEENEYIGFEYQVVGGDVCVAVKCGGDIFIEEGTGIWINPNGTFGPEAHAISNIVFCVADGDDDDDDDDDDDNDDDNDDTDEDDTDTDVVVE